MAKKGSDESIAALVAALISNLLIAITKFAASFVTGSAAMMSEGIHSLVDTGNELLMLHGIHKSKKPPDRKHPFGHGRELYFWSFMVAVCIFAVGGGVSVVEGISRLREGSPMVDAKWNYIVLGLSAVFEGVSWLYGWRAFSATRRGRAVLSAMHYSKDPTSFVVLLEDSVALTGLFIAFAGVLAGQLFGITWLDPAASILIGVMLCVVALFLGSESKSLIIGEAVDPDTIDKIREIVESNDEVEKVLKILTIYIGPDDVSATLELQFKKGMSAVELRRVIRRIEHAIEAKFSNIKRVYFEAQSISDKEFEASVS